MSTRICNNTCSPELNIGEKDPTYSDIFSFGSRDCNVAAVVIFTMGDAKGSWTVSLETSADRVNFVAVAQNSIKSDDGNIQAWSLDALPALALHNRLAFTMGESASNYPTVSILSDVEMYIK